MKKQVLFTALISIATLHSSFGQQSKSSDFKKFPLKGGYNLGAFFTEDKETKSIKLIQEINANQICHSNILESQVAQPLPSYTVDRKTEVQKEFSLNGKFSFLDLSGDANIDELKDVKLKLESGRKVYLSSGSSSVSKLFRVLNNNQLSDIKVGIEKGFYFVTELEIYDKASLVFVWNKKVNAEVQAKIKAGIVGQFSSETSTKFIDNETLEVTFPKGYKSGYKEVEVSKRDLKSSIKRKKKGYRMYYKDNDGDGFGFAEPSTDDYTNKPKKDYVENCEDCYDNVKNGNLAYTGQTK